MSGGTASASCAFVIEISGVHYVGGRGATGSPGRRLALRQYAALPRREFSADRWGGGGQLECCRIQDLVTQALRTTTAWFWRHVCGRRTGVSE
jgi:hypothetical protein